LGGGTRAIESVTEEALVRAIESAAVERAIARLLEGPAVETAMSRALTSPAVERAVMDALDSDLVDRLWARLLASDETQLLVERIAQAPEVRAAIAGQGIGLIEDLGRQLGSVARRLDDALDATIRRLLRRPPRTERSRQAGLITRALSVAADFGLVNLAFIAISALFALVFGRPDGDTSTVLAGTAFWLVLGSAYALFFWSLAGQTPGMRLVGIRLEAEGSNRIGIRRATRRLLGIFASLLTAGLGFLLILSSERRQGLHDRFSHTEVVYTPRGVV
jgi:uncharacterized RDD family membrane protein YckC